MKLEKYEHKCVIFFPKQHDRFL